MLAVNGGSTVGEVFHRLSTGQLQSADGFLLPEQYADSPVTCSIAPNLSGMFQSIPFGVKVQEAVEFGKYFKFVLYCSGGQPTTSRNAFDVLIKEAGRLTSMM